ncbi:MAG: tetratricopeptide repeat protein [Bacteroidia bacterium]|nr:tetratricopeptide repeat protein [Bacteroidia bacterium]
MSRQKPGKKEKFAAAAQAKAAMATDLKSQEVPAWWAWFPALLGFIAYANTLGFSFALDDYAAILENTSTQKGLAALGEIFRTSYRYGYILISDELYRPLPKAVFAVFWDLWPDNAVPGHWLNVMLFSLSCFLLYRFISSWWPAHKQVALLAASLFAVHPIHTEVVANIKSLDEILAFLFCMSSLHLYLQYNRSGKRSMLLLAALLYFLAFLCKESSITFLPLFPLLAYFILKKEPGASFRGFPIMLIPVVVFLLIRHQVLQSSGMFESAPPSVADNALMSAKDPLTRFSGAVAMLGLYVYKLLLPLQLSFDLSYPQVGAVPVSHWTFLVSATVLLAALLLALRGLRERRPYSFALLFFFITVSVSSNIFMMIGTHYGERLMYAPSFGVALLFAILAVDFSSSGKTEGARPGKPLMAVSGLIMVTFLFLTIQRNRVWRNNETLYPSGLISAPNSARVHYYNGLYLVKPEYLETLPKSSQDSAFNAGVMHLKKSVQLYPAFADAWTQLGVAAYRVKQYQESLSYYDQAMKYNPYDPVTLNNSGSVYFDMKEYDKALQRYLEAVKYKPDYAEAYMNIGSCYGVSAQFDQALLYLEKAIAADPSLAQAYYFMGITWRNKGNEAMATRYLQQYEQVKAGR